MPQTVTVPGARLLSERPRRYEDADLELATDYELLDFANRVRAACGSDPIPGLLPSIPGNPHTCLIARAVNSRIIVNRIARRGDGTQVWGMYLDGPQDIAEVAAALDLTADVDGEGELCIPLPSRIGNCAEAFDAGVAFQSYAGSE